MRDSRVLQSIACLAIAGSAAAIGFWCAGGLGPGLDRPCYQATGLVMAQQAVGLLKPGGRLFVIARDTTAFKNPASDTQLTSFRGAIAESHVAVSSVLSLQVDPLRPVEVPAGDFYELLRKTAPGDVIVSFMGPPLLSESQCSQLPATRGAVVAFCSGSLPDQVNLRAVFEAGLLQAAIITKKDATTRSPKPASLQECFDRSFLIITGSNLAMLSTPMP